MTEIRRAQDPLELPDWNRLAAERPFYCRGDWLRFADWDGGARSQYLSVPGRAALSAHWENAESADGYRASEHLATAGDATVLTFGGRRGRLSAPLIADTDCAPDLASLVSAALAREPRAENNWWWPYLPAPQAAEVVRATRDRWSPRVHPLEPDCTIDVPPDGLEEHIAALPTRQRRTNVRGGIRRYAARELRTVRGRLSDWTEVLGPLLANVQQKYGHQHSAELMTTMLELQAWHLDEHSVVFVTVEGTAARPVGFSLAYRHGSELSVAALGFDYHRLRGADEYGHLAVYEPMRYCHSAGLSRINLGGGSYAAKCRRGARVRPLWAVSTLDAAAAGRAEEPARELPATEAREFLTRQARERHALTT